MLYRDLHHAVDRLDRIDTPLRQAILAGSVREMTERAEEARNAIDQLLRQLQGALNSDDIQPEVESQDERVERVFTEAAMRSLRGAAAQLEQSSSATNVSTARAGLLDCKTRTDFAGAYLRASIGDEQT